METLTKYYEMLTKLVPPNLRVTLSQVPPSQKETWGAEGTPSFHTCPHVNSKPSIVICGPSDALHWPDASAAQQCGRCSEGPPKWS